MGGEWGEDEDEEGRPEFHGHVRAANGGMEKGAKMKRKGDQG